MLWLNQFNRSQVWTWTFKCMPIYLGHISYIMMWGLDIFLGLFMSVMDSPHYPWCLRETQWIQLVYCILSIFKTNSEFQVAHMFQVGRLLSHFPLLWWWLKKNKNKKILGNGDMLRVANVNPLAMFQIQFYNL